MNKRIVRSNKVALFSAVVASAICFGCSDDEASATGTELGNGVIEIPGDPISSSETPIWGESSSSIEVDPFYSSGVVDPVIDNPADPFVPASSTSLPQDPQTVSSSSYGFTPVSSSSVFTAQSSSSGLKDYEDNHAAKESVLPAAGFYSSLTINPPTPRKGGEIKCSFDGSFPTQGSQPISTAMQITENTVIRCSEFVNGQPADTTTQTYFIGENVSMPVVALTVNHHDMFDSTDGLYATGLMNNLHCTNPNFNTMAFGVNTSDNNNPKCTEPCYKANFWCEDEIPVHVEFFENGSSNTGKNWEIDAGISLIGNWSRYKPKKSVAIKMDNDDYGDKVLKYSLFKTRPEAKKFKSFNLRNNGNRFWTDYIGDAMMTSLMEGTEVDYQRSRQVVVFYNGEYFGIHDMRERLNRHFVETNYGIDSKSINMINVKGSNFEASGTNGSSTQDFQQMVNMVASGNFQGESNQQYEQLKQYLNVNSFAQYMLAEMYFHNGDWPDNNVRAWGGNGAPFKYVAFDTDHGFGFNPGIQNFDTQGENMFNWVLGASNGQQQAGGDMGWGGGFGGGFGWGNDHSGDSRSPGGMLKKLLENADFKRMFVNNACILLNDFLTYEKVQKKVQEMMATIPSSEQQRDQQRWPRNQSNFNWAPSGSDLINFAQNRSETVKQEMAARFQLGQEVNVTIGANGGTVTVDDMKLPSANYRGKFYVGNPLKLTAVAGAGRVFTGWSDGVTENPRLVEPSEGLNISAMFK